MGAKEILFKANKRGKQRAYTYSRGQMRWFPMHGGNLAMADQKVYRVHDRFESPELNDLLSR